jgi:hypothetical protein
VEDKLNPSLQASPEQLLYARILEKGMLIGLLVLLITFAIYTFGIMKPYIPLDKISGYWHLNVHDYLNHPDLQIKAGWGWLHMLAYGDFINFVGVAILAGVTILCFVSIIPTLLRNNDKLYAVMAALEAVVLAAAASGILTVGH